MVDDATLKFFRQTRYLIYLWSALAIACLVWLGFGIDQTVDSFRAGVAVIQLSIFPSSVGLFTFGTLAWISYVVNKVLKQQIDLQKDTK